METFTLAVNYLKDVLNGIEKTKSQGTSNTRNLFMALCKVHSTSKSAEQAELCANSNLNIFEEILCSKFTVLNKSMQTTLSSIYEVLLANTPGYVARNIINALLGVCNSKSTSLGGRECAVTVIGKVMEKRSSDLGSSINDVIACMTRVIRNMELPIRIVAIQSLISLLVGAGARVNDCHIELTRLGSKLASDKAIDVRQLAAVLLAEIGRSSGGFTSVSCDLLLAPVSKGLEDEVAVVQDSFAQAAAALYLEQINAHVAGQEQAKIDLARGGSATEGATTSPPKQKRQSSILRLKEMAVLSSQGPQKPTEAQDFKAVVGGIMKSITRSAATLRAGYVSTLQHLCEEVVSTLDDETLGWLGTSVILLLRDPLIGALPYEEIVHFRSRLAHLLRRGVTARITESNQLLLAHHLVSFLGTGPGRERDSSVPVRNEHELQLGMGELGVVVTALGEASSALCDDVKALATGQLRNSNFGVRAAAASLAFVIPAVGASFLTDALNGATVQVKQLLAFSATDSGLSAEGRGEENGVEEGGRKKKVNPKEAERLQRMFYFHGYTLVISIFLKNEKNIPTGLPIQLIMQAFDFGLELLTLDIQAAPLEMRHVICSIIRAGSLVVSSCLNMGYTIAKPRIPRLLECCAALLAPCSHPIAPIPSPTAGQELLYELMSVEAALVCISTLLWFCPESLMNDENCLVTIVDGLESAFRAIKTKYQSKFKTHFRFRTLHVILLECFSWLPPGSFPNTCSQLFVEALRVFRDSITTGFECTCLNEFVPPDHSILYTFGVSRSSAFSFNDPPLSEHLMVLRLESYSVALQKKESEAFLMCFSTEAERGSTEFRRTPLHASDWTEPSPPCAFIDSRTIDASISLIAATFGHQSNDYQEKAIQLCSQAVAQYIKGASSASALGLFTTSEDKMRKDKKNYVSLKNVTAVLSAIIRSFPFHNGMSLEMDLQWVQTVADIMFDMLSYPYAEIRSASSTALGTFCSKIFGAQLMDSMGMKITNALRTSVDKKGETLGELSGHLLAISALSLNATNLPGVQNNIATIIFDTLKRTDSSLHFRAHGIFALSSMLHSRALLEGTEMGGQLVEKVMQVLEVHLLHGSTPNDSAAIYEYDLLLVCLQRLVNVTTSLLMDIDPTSENLLGLVKVWSVIHKASSHISVQHECTEFLLIGSVTLLSSGTLDPLETTLFVQNSLADPRHLKTEHLQDLVQCVRVLATMDSDVVCAAGLDITLFQLLDWCVASNTARNSSPYWGVELRAGVQDVLQRHAELQRDIESTLEFLVDVNVQVAPEKRATHWVLLCRVIALGLKTTSGGNVDHDEEEEKGGGEEGGMNAQKDVAVPDNAMENVHFANWCRDRAVEGALSLNSTRSRLKYMALRCATAATIAGGAQKHGVSLHSDLLLGRQMTQVALSALGTATPEQHQLVDMECYMSLFLHDFISLGCACAAFSIEDHRLLSLQTASLQFLQAVVTIFWNAIDPDFVHTTPADVPGGNSSDVITQLSTAPAEKLLLQFMAQITSAVRSCLAANYAPQLSWTAGSLVFDFIRGGLVADKVVVRRLGKILQSSVEEQGEHEKSSEGKPKSSGSLVIPLRTPTSVQVAGKVATIQDVVCMANFARLHLLTTSLGKQLGDVSEEVVQCVGSLTTSHLAAVTPKWIAIATDAARILQSEGSPWPAETPDSHPRRGGVTYDPRIDPRTLKIHYELALPYVVAAACASPNLPDSKLAAMFAISRMTLKHLHNLSSKNTSRVFGEVKEDSSLIKNEQPSLELLVLHALSSLAVKSSSQTAVPLEEWIYLLSFLGDSIADKSSKMEASSSWGVVSNYSFLVVAIGATLLPQVVARCASESKQREEKTEDGESESESDGRGAASARKGGFVHALWKSLVSIMRVCFAGIFDPSSNVPSSEQEPRSQGADVYPKLAVSCGQVGQEEGALRWWVNDSKNITLVLQLLKVCSCLAQFANDPVMDTYLANVLVTLITYFSLRAREQPLKDLLTTVNSILQELAARGGGLVITDCLAHELWVLHSREVNKPFLGATEISVCTGALFTTWVVLTSSLVSEHSAQTCPIPSAPHLSAAIMSTASPPSFLVPLLATSLQFLQLQAQQKVTTDISFSSSFVEVRVIIAAIIPFFLHRLSAQKASPAYAEVDKLSLQLIFGVFNIIPEDVPRQAYLSALLSPLCEMYTRRGEADPSTLMCGKGVTHIARTHPQLFRQAVGLLPPEQSQNMQSLMRLALQSMQAQPNVVASPAGSVGGSTPGSIKKLDMKKWNKN